MKLKDGGDARAHIEKMLSIREDLSSMGRFVSDEDLFNILFTSLPRSYNTILSSVSSTMKLHNCIVTSDTLISLVLDEYDHLVSQS
ncbi:hypothetical protein PAXINDRAFT_69271, partial [Paxillus involutus ATCC 200175]